MSERRRLTSQPHHIGGRVNPCQSLSKRVNPPTPGIKRISWKHRISRSQDGFWGFKLMSQRGVFFSEATSSFSVPCLHMGDFTNTNTQSHQWMLLLMSLVHPPKTQDSKLLHAHRWSSLHQSGQSPLQAPKSERKTTPNPKHTPSHPIFPPQGGRSWGFARMRRSPASARCSPPARAPREARRRAASAAPPRVAHEQGGSARRPPQDGHCNEAVQI